MQNRSPALIGAPHAGQTGAAGTSDSVTGAGADSGSFWPQFMQNKSPALTGAPHAGQTGAAGASDSATGAGDDDSLVDSLDAVFAKVASGVETADSAAFGASDSATGAGDDDSLVDSLDAVFAKVASGVETADSAASATDSATGAGDDDSLVDSLDAAELAASGSAAGPAACATSSTRSGINDKSKPHVVQKLSPLAAIVWQFGHSFPM